MSDLHELERKSREIGRMLKDSMPAGVGFTLVMFNFGEGGFTSYISTASRDDTINMLRELAVMIELEGTGPGCPSN